MSWLSPDQREKFQRLQQQAPQAGEEAAAGRHPAKPLFSLAGKSDAAPSTHQVNKVDGVMDSSDGHSELRRDNWQHTTEVLRGPEGAVQRREEFLDERQRIIGLEQQSSGNIAKKFLDEEYGRSTAVAPSSVSTPALHLEHYKARGHGKSSIWHRTVYKVWSFRCF